jgi:hypothetical protein
MKIFAAAALFLVAFQFISAPAIACRNGQHRGAHGRHAGSHMARSLGRGLGRHV